jgi:hypothetical protein
VSNRANGKRSFFTSEETDTFYVEEGFWVELKKELDYGEENELEGAAIRAGVSMAGTGPATPTLEYSVGNQRELMLALYICDWNLSDDNDKPVPLPDSLSRRREIVKRLSPRFARTIMGRIDQLRAEAMASDVISLAGEDDAAVDPTAPGAASEPETPSSSDDGLAVSVTETSSARPLALSGKRSR